MTIIIGLIVLSLMVFFHETGHFVFARIFGVKVLSFSIGMGPVLLHKTIRGTDYRISLLPFGGYCGMKGEKDFTSALESGSNKIDAEPDSLYGTHPLKRAAIGFAGPFFNFITAIVAYTIIAVIGYSYQTRSATIDIPQDPDFYSPAREAGIISGDTITKINGKEIADFSDIFSEISIRPDEDVSVEVLRDGERLEFTVHTLLDKEQGIGFLGVQSAGELIEREMPRQSFFPAIGHSVMNTAKMISLTLKGISILFKGVDMTNVVAGPARISSMLGEGVKEGFSAGFKIGVIMLCEFMALISISAGIMNLLPIPVLDGGLIIIAILEALTKKQIPPRIQQKIQIVGIAIIVSIVMFVLFGDAKYFFTKSAS